MEFSSRGRRNTLIFALLTLILLGLTLMASTWQILRQQEDVSFQHMGVSARSIARTVENSYRRSMMGMGLGADFWPRLQELFADVGTGGDIQFIEIFDEDGLRIAAARSSPVKRHFIPLPEQMRVLEEKGEWSGVVKAQRESFFVLASRLNPPNMRLNRRSRVLGQRLPFVAVGMSLDIHENMYKSFRHNAVLQSLYILAAAVFIWGLAVALFSRRSLLGKTRFLERFQAQLLDNMPDGLITVGKDQYIQAANQVAHELLDFAEGALVGRKISELPDKLLRIMEQSEVQDGQLGWRRAEVLGKQLEILTTSFKGEYDDPTLLMLVRNRTRLHNLESSLAQAEKMAAVGSLAAGVAHEIRNPLAALRGFAQYFAGKFSGQEPEGEFARTMVQEADRLNRVITDLLYLARNKPLACVEAHLPALAGEVKKLLRLDLENKRVDVECVFALEILWADEEALKQALLNLMLNSLDAVEEYRLKTAENDIAAETEAQRGKIVVRSYIQDGWDVLEVEDNGAGMDEGHRRQAFDAFFTTKAKGTGLGLALVHKTMHEHGGHARIRSLPLRGCAVSLCFPPAGGFNGQGGL
ncbi:MAG: PAS domain-containing sensor histidine kinase [Deltaproteobacteria bacterium]|jgi:signal transduction histidine kinase|nr:PAS domain-containing sensor histidine kinase [Deltaproteobacteria bacterium]